MAIDSTFTVDGSAISGAMTTTYGASVALAVTTLTDINTIVWSIIGNSSTSLSNPTITQAGSPSGATASFTMVADPGDGAGVSFVVKCVATDSGGNTDTTTAVIGVANTAGLVPFAAAETTERSSTHGWTEDFNTHATGLLTLLAAKEPVKTVALENIASLSSVTVATDFDTAVVEGDRVLLFRQTSAAENGVYDVGVVGGGSAALTRSADFNSSTLMVQGALFAVTDGTLYQGEIFRHDTSGAITVDTTAIELNAVSGLVYAATDTLSSGAGATTLYTHACADDTLTTLAALITAEDTGGDTCHAASTMVVERQSAGSAVNKRETYVEPHYLDDAAWSCPDFDVSGNNATVAMTADSANDLDYKLWVFAWEHAI